MGAPRRKHRIAAAAAERIADGETVILNGGAPTQAVAYALGIWRHLTIVTNNLRVPTALPACSVRDVYLLGGSCRLASYVPVGAKLVVSQETWRVFIRSVRA